MTYAFGVGVYEMLVRGDHQSFRLESTSDLAQQMMESFLDAARQGYAPAFRSLGDIYASRIDATGVFDGISPDAVRDFPWSDDARTIVDDASAIVQTALRAYAEAARLSDRASIGKYVLASRFSTPTNQMRGIAAIAALDDPTAYEHYLAGLANNWIEDYESSARAYARAAARGNLDAMFELYVYLSRAVGVPRSLLMARHYLELAAEGGHARALYQLGATYATGSLGQQDIEQAARLYARAAKQGHGRAAATLAVMILSGAVRGTDTEASNLLSCAEENGCDPTTMLQALEIADPRGPESARRNGVPDTERVSEVALRRGAPN